MAAGRPRALDVEASLPVIVRLFWRDGFDRLTLDEVASELGVTKPTLCRTLGDKEGIFSKAIEAYYQAHIRPGEERLETAATLRRGLEGCFATSIERALDETNPPGCLLTDTSLRGAFTTGPVAQTLATIQSRTAKLLMRRIQAAIEDGELSETTDPSTVLNYVMAQFAAISALSRTSPTRTELERAVGFMLNGLPWSTKANTSGQ